MNSKEYQNVTFLRGQYVFIPYTGTVTKEDLLFIYNCTEDELGQYISPDEIEFVQEWMNEGGSFNYLVDIIKSDFSKMTRDEISQNIDEFIDAGIYDREVLGSVPDVNILIDKFDSLGNDNDPFFTIGNQQIEYYTRRGMVANSIEMEDLFNYLNENGKASDAVIDFLAKETTVSVIANAMVAIKSDAIKTKILIKYEEEEKKQPLIQYVNDAYYRNQIMKASEVDELELIAQVDQYSNHLKMIDALDDESQKTEYILSIQDRDMKQFLMSKLKEHENREIVINSFQRYVDPEITDIDQLMQTMIREFFEDTLGEQYTEDKRERLKTIFNRTDIWFQDLEEKKNGQARYPFTDIIISSKYKGNINSLLGVLAHEYEHLLSVFISEYNIYDIGYIEEEGMADLFADLVINHYLKKHNVIIINGKQVRVDNPYIVYSGYDYENSWVRTMIAGLESSGRDMEAVGEYVLGSKYKYYEMILGKELLSRTLVSESGIPNINIDRKLLYNSPELDYSNIDRTSIYYNRNQILPLYIIQNRMKDNVDLLDGIERGKQLSANYIAHLYFSGRKFYEVPSKELGEFIELLNEQISLIETAIVEIDEYRNGQTNELTDDEIRQNSFEVLSGIIELWENEEGVTANDYLEQVVKLAIKQEIHKIEEGQPIEVTRNKRKRIVEKYLEMFPKKSRNNIFINDYIKDFDFECEQAEYRQEGSISISNQTIQIIAREEGVPEKKEFATEGITAIQNNQEQLPQKQGYQNRSWYD